MKHQASQIYLILVIYAFFASNSEGKSDLGISVIIFAVKLSIHLRAPRWKGEEKKRDGGTRS